MNQIVCTYEQKIKEKTKKAPEARNASEKKTFSNTNKEERSSRRPPRGRPLPAERAAGVKRAPRGDMPTPRFKKTDGERKSFGDRAPRAGGDRPSFGRGAPRGGSDRPAFGERKSFGDRAPRASVDREGDRQALRGDDPRGGSIRPTLI